MNAAESVPTLSLVLPTYNERRNLPRAIERVIRAFESTGLTFEIIVVDDDSPDETWKLAYEMSLTDSRVRVLRRRGERGLATAVVAGWRQARGRVLGVMDADLQYPPETLPTMLKALDRDGVDIAICSRYAPGATVQQWSALRWLVSRAARLVGRLVLRTALLGIADPGAGYFLVRRRVIEGVDLRPRGFKILIEVLARGHYAGVVEVGLPYEGRKEGQSKFRGRQVVEYVTQLLELNRDTGERVRSIQRLVLGLISTTFGLGTLWGLTAGLGLHYLVSGAIAAEIAILGIFPGVALLGHLRPKPGHSLARSWWDRLGRWHLLRLPAGVVGFATLLTLTEQFGVPYFGAALLAVPLTALTNYLVSVSRRGREWTAGRLATAQAMRTNTLMPEDKERSWSRLA
jgi:dolichol-phosphate mannosyltransferase